MQQIVDNILRSYIANYPAGCGGIKLLHIKRRIHKVHVFLV